MFFSRLLQACVFYSYLSRPLQVYRSCKHKNKFLYDTVQGSTEM